MTELKFYNTGKKTSLDSILKEIFATLPAATNAKSTKKQLKNSQIDVLKNELIECCLTHMQDSYRIHLNRVRGLKILDTLVTLSPINKITPELATHMVWAALSCNHHFLLRLSPTKSVMQWMRRKVARKAIRIYDKLLYFLTPTFYSVVFSAVVTFFEEANIWNIEFFCSNLLRRVLMAADDKTRTESILEIINLVENSTLTNTLASRQILQVLFDIEEAESWTWINNSIAYKILEMYYNSLVPESNFDYNYECLDKGLESFLRALAFQCPQKQLVVIMCWMLEVLTSEDMTDDNLLTFGGLLEHITALYTKHGETKPLPEDVLPPILKVISSENLVYSLLGHRILHKLIDRCNNREKFSTPKIFLKNYQYNIVVNDFKRTDKMLFQRFREAIHNVAIQSLEIHGFHKIYLENIYITLALFIVEIPCAYTAAAGVCVAMGFQQTAIESKNIQITHAHRIHATVMSIMSLICYIHKASVFYDYVEKIVDRRANFAPHLNPPLKKKYLYAPHHVLWNKPDLFFEDWEVRYGLWKCFRNQHKDIVVVPT